MAKYAEGTTVPTEQTMLEIKKLLAKYGATSFVYGEQSDRHIIMFEVKGRRLRLTLPIPPIKQFRGYVGNTYRLRTEGQAKEAQQAEIRRLWRALLLVIKAKLEIVESGISSFEQEFLSYTMLPDGETVGEWMEPQINDVYQSGKMPPLLPGAAIALPAPKER